jgi:hypothetical protein
MTRVNLETVPRAIGVNVSADIAGVCFERLLERAV